MSGLGYMDHLLAPGSVAVIGASEGATRIGGRHIAAMLRAGNRLVSIDLNPVLALPDVAWALGAVIEVEEE